MALRGPGWEWVAEQLVPSNVMAEIERCAVRVVLQDAAGSLLMFEAIDPAGDAVGTWWELPGGGVEVGEDVVATALREIAEETGLALAPEQVGAPTWRRSVTYLRRGRRVLQHEVVVAVELTERAPTLVREGQTNEELEDYLGHRWWPLPELFAAVEQGLWTYPGRLGQLLPRFLAGQQLAEPFERWN